MMVRHRDEGVLDVSAAMQGSLAFADPVNLRINGKFQGSLTTKGNLIVGRNAEVNADIVGENIVISGQVKGKIKATITLKLTSGAQVNADIETAKIYIEEGAIFNGKIEMLGGKISLEELSDYLSIEEGKIMEWVQAGKIPVENQSHKLLFDRKEVENWIAQKP